MIDRQPCLDGNRDGVDEFTCTRTHHDTTHDDARGPTAKKFDETTTNIKHFGARIGVQRQEHRVDSHITSIHLLLGHAHRRNLRGCEDGAGYDATIQWTDGVTQCVPHGDAPLHGSDGCQHEHSGAITRCVHPPCRGSGDAIHHDEAALITLHPGLIEAQSCRIGDRADREEGMASLDRRAISQCDEHSPVGAGDRLSTRM